MEKQVIEYILAHWKDTVRKTQEDEGTRIGLPYPYTVPSMKEVFNELYYWDTYFTNRGLIACRLTELAKNNCQNIAYLIEKIGYMPNGSRTVFYGRSQPPFFALMVKDIYEVDKDKAWLLSMCKAIEKELEFWDTRRKSKNGLNYYSVDNDDAWCKAFFEKNVRSRVRVEQDRDWAFAGRCFGGEAESGWDFTNRFGGYCCQYNAVDLNALLYAAESLLGEFLRECGCEGEAWTERANARKQKMNSLLYNKERGAYLDYNFVTGEHSKILSAASFTPYFVRLADEERKGDLPKLLSALELPYGVSATIGPSEGFQWGYPNVWAPIQAYVATGLENYGYIEESERVKAKYLRLVESNFEKTGGLFEKYNGLSGGCDAVSEYGTPQMMGWTAGTYAYFIKEAIF